MNRLRIVSTLNLILLLTVVSGIDVNANENRLRWNGFLSVGGGIVLDDNETFMADPPSKGVYDDHAGFKPDTILGLQASVDLEEGLSVTAQLIARGGNDFDAELEWAYLNYIFDEHVTLSAGRRRVPIYYYSETLDLGYSYHWVRPPFEVYSIPLTAYEGVSFSYKSWYDEWDSNIEIWGGEAEGILLGGPGTMIVRDMLGVAWKVGYQEWFNFRMLYSYQVADVFFDGIPFPVSEGNNIEYTSSALVIDRGLWFIMGEYTVIQIEKDFNHQHNWYVSVGARAGAVTPHLTFGEYKEKSSSISNGEEQHTITVGVRYDVHPNAALKVEFSSVNNRSDSPGFLLGDSEVVVISLDITF